jgi:hypothetical protein
MAVKESSPEPVSQTTAVEVSLRVTVLVKCVHRYDQRGRHGKLSRAHIHEL